MNVFDYDDSNPISIENYAKKLLNKSLSDVLRSTNIKKRKGKGSLGETVEKYYFGYEPNSNPEPDFPKAGVEVKVTPLKISRNKLVSKERLVFNIINYNEEYKLTFITSSFWKKNGLLLLMFYLSEADKLDREQIFQIIRLWRIPLKDLKIIKDDWNKIVSKIKNGLAHEISEGDTLYLGACTKGSTKAKSMVTQPFSDVKAHRRAFSLKSKYLNFIINESLSGREVLQEVDEAYKEVLGYKDSKSKEPEYAYRKSVKEAEPFIKDLSEIKDKTLEELVLEKFEPHYGKTLGKLKEELNLSFKDSAKHKGNILARAILGVRKLRIEEFEKADIEMKTIPMSKTGKLEQSMSFKQIQFKEIIHENWEDSYWFNILTKRFFFVILKRNAAKEQTLHKAMFWAMPNQDLKIAHKFWKDTKLKVAKGDYDNFMKLADHMICHIRPKGNDANDLMETPQGKMEKKKCYWLNAAYILEQISKQ